jgi:5'-nucleotidase
LEVKTAKLPDNSIGFLTSGTPADCARLGFTTLAEQPVDLVVSGINNDTNLGFDVNYSGTVAAALEAAGAGLPAVAASLERSLNYDWETAGQILKTVVENYSAWNIPLGVMLNLNIPQKPQDLNLWWCRPDTIPNPDYYEKTAGPEGIALYTRLRNEDPHASASEDIDFGNDVSLNKAGHITISPLITVNAHLETLNRLQKTMMAQALP